MSLDRTQGDTETSVPLPPAHGAVRKSVWIGGVQTSYLEVGAGWPVILLHGGEPGASGELSWEYNIPALASRYRVIVPDLPGYGYSSKLHDFENNFGFLLRHLKAFCDELNIDAASFVGTSMTASLLVKDAASTERVLPMQSVVLIAGGGFAPDNEARQTLTKYDGSYEGMRAILRVMFHCDRWWLDDKYVSRRHSSSIQSGAWEAVAAMNFDRPGSVRARPYGSKDETPYENVNLPVLLLSGDRDKLKNPGYTTPMVSRLPNVVFCEISDVGHCPHIEAAERVNEKLLDFLG